MVISITVNVPVKNVARATTFLKNVGFQVNPMFATEPEMELIDLSDAVHVMLNTEPRFASISNKQVADATTDAEAILQLRVDSRQAVDELVDRALASGGKPIHEPNVQEYIYGRSLRSKFPRSR
jgi:uncharacterized protein